MLLDSTRERKSRGTDYPHLSSQYDGLRSTRHAHMFSDTYRLREKRKSSTKFFILVVALQIGCYAIPQGKLDLRRQERLTFLIPNVQSPPSLVTKRKGWFVYYRYSKRRAPRRTRERHLRSKIWWFTEFCNSHYISHFAAFFIVARTKISIVKSCMNKISFQYCAWFNKKWHTIVIRFNMNLKLW